MFYFPLQSISANKKQLVSAWEQSLRKYRTVWKIPPTVVFVHIVVFLCIPQIRLLRLSITGNLNSNKIVDYTTDQWNCCIDEGCNNCNRSKNLIGLNFLLMFWDFCEKSIPGNPCKLHCLRGKYTLLNFP